MRPTCKKNHDNYLLKTLKKSFELFFIKFMQ